MARSLLNSQWNNSTLATSLTVYGAWGMGGVAGNSSATTEATKKVPYRTAGTVSKMGVVVTANSISATTTARSRKNGSNGGLTVSITASTTGGFFDTSGSDTLAAGDLYNLQIVTGGSGTTIQLRSISAVFEATTGTTTVLLMTSNGQTYGTASTTWYALPAGFAPNWTSAPTSETGMGVPMPAGTLDDGSVYISANSRTTNTTFKCRVNGADHGPSISVGNVATGLFEDSTGYSISDTDLVNWAVTTSTGAQNITIDVLKLELTTTTSMSVLCGGSNNPAAQNSNLTRYVPLGEGDIGPNSTENNVKAQIGTVATIERLATYISANTVSAASTYRTRKNAGNGNNSVSITASTTGAFQDTTHTDAFSATTDAYNGSMVTGATGTSLTAKYYTAWLSAALIYAGVGAATVTGLAPQIGPRLNAGTGVLTATGVAPQVPTLVAAGVGVLTVTGYEPSFPAQGITPGTGVLTIDGLAPTVPVQLNADVGALTVTGLAPTVPTNVNADVGALVVTGLAPTLPTAIHADTGALAVTGLAPTVPTSIQADLGALTVDGLAPTVPTRLQTDVGSLVVSGLEPSVPSQVASDTGQLLVTGYEPTLPTVVLTDVGSVVLSGFQPTVGLDINVYTETGAVVVTGYAPAIPGVITPVPSSLHFEVNQGQGAVFQDITITGGPFTGLGYSGVVPDPSGPGWLDPQVPIAYVMRVYVDDAYAGLGTFVGGFYLVADGTSPVWVPVLFDVYAVAEAYPDVGDLQLTGWNPDLDVGTPSVPGATVVVGGSGRQRKPAKVLRYEEMLRQQAAALERAALQATAERVQQDARQVNQRNVQRIKRLEDLARAVRDREDEDDLLTMLATIL